jgi:hypothetical protein
MNNNSDKELIPFHFRYKFKDGTIKDFILKLDRQTLTLVQTRKRSYPEWTKLQYCKCPNCSLSADQHEFCPIAVSLVDLIYTFKDSVSYEEVDVLITTEARTYMKQTTLQKGLSSLLGIYMVTSGCPTMQKLKPMVRYHLPFATKEETLYRVLSMYLLAQYFLSKRGRKPDWELKDLVNLYQNIKILNKSFSERLSHIDIKDASLNALVILDWFAENLTFSLNKDVLEEIELLFNAYFKE